MVLGLPHVSAILMFLSAAAFMLTFATPAHAASERYCQPTDLRGVYKMLDLRESPPGLQSANWAKYPFQYLSFLADGKRYSHVADLAELPSVEAAKTHLAWPERQGVRLDYTLTANGVLDFNDQGNLTDRLRCFIIVQPHDRMQKGDLALSGYTRYKTEIYKLYRRWF